MQRIVAGHLRGRRLRALPTGVAVRPTAARVREAIFSRLFDRVVGVTLLDLFAGSGAFTFEALSRGAERAIAVDHDAAVIRHLRAQSEDFCLSKAVECVHGDACTWLRRGRGSRPPAALVFVDPPYAEVALPNEVLAALAAGGWLCDRA
ncbi:MAG TPA: 16S rRNA (guanine(966)-N(2))-methyltransferase RsmD, partial [Nannocystis exedens]|nr:16S rRNA (guanine(966)-N(2))-methyltransferase RsmD [Nannocystis exedens]